MLVVWKEDFVYEKKMVFIQFRLMCLEELEAIYEIMLKWEVREENKGIKECKSWYCL